MYIYQTINTHNNTDTFTFLHSENMFFIWLQNCERCKNEMA